MISAADVMTRAVAAMPLTTDSVLSPVVEVLLPDPGQQEHLVVHRQPEEDGEHHHRHEADDRHRSRARRTGRSPQPHWKTATITP